MVVGHPFKGGMMLSTGYLAHPDAKRFGMNDSTLLVPPRPNAWATTGTEAPAAPQIPSFGDFFATYFAGRSFDVSNQRCSTMLEGMKRCYENHSSESPVDSCQYYIQGFERFACGRN